MIKFRVGIQPKSTVTSWYNTLEGITEKLTSLEGFKELIHARYIAGYEKDENLSEFYVLGGKWSLDSCGNCSKSDKDLKLKFPSIPDVLTHEEFWNLLKKNVPDSEHLSMSFTINSSVPTESITCPVCKKNWDIHNCYDAVVHNGYDKEKEISLKAFVGQTIQEVKIFFANKTDAIYRMNQPEQIIRNDRYIDLTPHPAYADYNAEHPQNLFVMNKNGWMGVKEGIDDSYVIQEGDDGYFNIWKFFHHKCNRRYLNRQEYNQFKRIFKKAGFKDIKLLSTPNQYCSCDNCASWYNVHTPYGKILIGWRKRVIDIDWSSWGVDFNYLFKKEDVTKSKSNIHAWGEKKAIEYLSIILKEIDGNTELKQKILTYKSQTK